MSSQPWNSSVIHITTGVPLSSRNISIIQKKNIDRALQKFVNREMWGKVHSLQFMFMLSSSSRAILGDIISNLYCMAISWRCHLSSCLPGFLCVVKGKNGVEKWSVISSWQQIEYYKTLRQYLSTEYKDNIVDSPGSQVRSWRRKPGGGESPPGPIRILQDLSGV